VLEGKRLGLLRALVPGVELIAVLLNPNRPNHADEVREVQEAARAIGQQIHILLASSESSINAAFATATQVHAAGALLVGSDAFFNSQRDKIIALAARHSIPTVYEQRDFALAGGLMSYGTNLANGYRQVGA
jgi:putative ABC transport system substrate-binding protein